MDGLLYADIARNLAEGRGTFWKPHLTEGLYSDFYEHPPLAFGLQSIFFKLFGDSIYVERFYSLGTFILVGYLMQLIWNQLTQDKKMGWLPLIFWTLTGGIGWAVANNMLENTMSIFVCVSVLFILYSMNTKRLLFLGLAGASLALGLLTKGFFCLYIWGMPFFAWMFWKRRNFWVMSLDTLLLIFFTVAPITLVYFTNEAAQNNMMSYVNNQLIGSLKHVQTVDSRFSIVINFFKSILVPLALAVTVFFIAKRKEIEKPKIAENWRVALMLFAVVLSGVFPIMISLKQRTFYILTVYPIFSIGLAYLLLPYCNFLYHKIEVNSKGYSVFVWTARVLATASIVLAISQINRVGRDHAMIHDSKAVVDVVGKNTKITICTEMHAIWSLHGYLSRYGNVSLDKNYANLHQYFLSKDGCIPPEIKNQYDLVPLETKVYQLFKRKNYLKN